MNDKDQQLIYEQYLQQEGVWDTVKAGFQGGGQQQAAAPQAAAPAGPAAVDPAIGAIKKAIQANPKLTDQVLAMLGLPPYNEIATRLGGAAKPAAAPVPQSVGSDPAGHKMNFAPGV